MGWGNLDAQASKLMDDMKKKPVPPQAQEEAGHFSPNKAQEGEAKYGPHVCPRCHGYGFYTPDVEPGHKGFGLALRCNCGDPASLQRRMDAKFDRAGVPPKYRAFRFRDFEEKAKSDDDKVGAVVVVNKYIAEGHVDGKNGIFLYGPSGTGKTGCLTPLFVYLMSKGKSGVWIGYYDLMAELRDFESGAVNDRFDGFCRADMLFIDDLFDPMTTNVSDYTRESLYRIIEYRATHNLPIFVTSNVDLQGIADRAHVRIARRLNDMCVTAEVGGKPFDALARAKEEIL